MTGPSGQSSGFGDLAAEPPKESVAAEEQAVGDDEDTADPGDTGDTVPPDGAQ